MLLKNFKYKKEAKYVISSLVSSFFEFLIFFLITTFYKDKEQIILIATISGRIVGTIINFFINKYWCFKVYDKTIFQIILFIILFIFKLFMSYFLVNYLVERFNINPTLIKVPVDIFLFFFGYVIQNFVIFRKKKEEANV